MPGPMGEEHTISAGGYTAVVVEGGAGLRTLTHDDVTLVAGYAGDEQATGGRGQILIPWPNRLRDGRYAWAGKTQQLPLSEPSRGNASHGLVRWTTWQVRGSAEDRVALTYRLVAQPGYPWSLDLTASYAVSADGLRVELTGANLASTPAPYAVGMHPYLTAGTDLVDETVLTLPAGTRQLVDARLLPTSTEPVRGDYDFRSGRPVGGLQLDDAFTDLQGERPVVRLEGTHTVELVLDPCWRWVQVFTGDTLSSGARTAMAVEPMTAPADAFNSGLDLITLEPGEQWSGGYTIRRADTAQA